MTTATVNRPQEAKAHQLLAALRGAGDKGLTAEQLFSLGIANPDWLSDMLQRQYPDLVIGRRCIDVTGGRTMHYWLELDTQLGQGTLL